MAVQFNLLPDVKLEYDRNQRNKRLVYTLAGIACVVALGLFVLSYISVNVLQKTLLDKANDDITSYSKKLKDIPNLDKILTIQNQLSALPGEHSQKHYASRLLAYLPQITPTKVNIGKINVDTVANTVTITGTADTVESVNKFVDTIKFTKFTLADSKDSNNAFSSVLLTKIDRDDKGAIYTITANYDPALFTGTKSVTLVVPQETTTRSVINSPGASPLFNGQTGEKKDQQGAQ